MRNALLQAKSQESQTAIDLGWMNTAIAMVAFCTGFSYHKEAVRQISAIQVFEDPASMTEPSLFYCINVCIFWVESVAKHPLVSVTEQVKICSLLLTSLRAVQCHTATGADQKKMLAAEILPVQLAASISLASGYLAIPLSISLPEIYGVSLQLVALTTRLLGTRTATRLLSLTCTWPWATQKASMDVSRLIRYFTYRASARDQLQDFKSAFDFYDAPTNLSSLSALSRRERYRSPSSSSESSGPERKTRSRRMAKRTRRSSPPHGLTSPSPGTPRPPRPGGRPGRSPGRRPASQKPSQWRGQRIGKCPRDSSLPCRGRWYSHKLQKVEFCAYGCEPISK